MKKLVCALALVFSLVGCGDDAAPTGGGGGTQATSGAATAPQKVYECPMHCIPEGQTVEHTQNEPGRCPVCGMDLVERQ